MPAKWTLYYLCSLYLILWAAFLFFLVLWSVIADGIRNADDGIGFSIVIAVVLVMVFKSVLSIRGIGHYKKVTLFSKNERVMFIVGFTANAIFTVVIIIFCFAFIIPQDFVRHAGYTYDDRPTDYMKYVLDFSVFALVLGCFFMAIFDLPLLKAIRRKYYDSLLVLGEGLVDRTEL